MAIFGCRQFGDSPSTNKMQNGSTAKCDQERFREGLRQNFQSQGA